MCNHAIEWSLKVKVGNINAKLVLIALANDADASLQCFGYEKSITQRCEISRRSVYRAITYLIKGGFIARESRRWDTGVRRSPRYTLLMAKPSATCGHNVVPPETGEVPAVASNKTPLKTPLKKNQTLGFMGEAKRKPRHGQRTRDGKRVWLDVETDDFKAYIQDQGNTPLLWNGSGAWFAYY